MQYYKGLYIDVYSIVQEYDRADFYNAGRDTAKYLAQKINQSGRDNSFVPQIAIVLFTDPADGPDSPLHNRINGTVSPGIVTQQLKALCLGINDGFGLGKSQRRFPLIGGSVASLPDIETRKLYSQAFSITLLVSRQRDLCAHVGASDRFFYGTTGYEQAIDEVMLELDYDQEARCNDMYGSNLRASIPKSSFLLSFFPGHAKSEDRETNEKEYSSGARMREAHRYLRQKIPSDVPIFGMGTADLGARRWSHVMCGNRLLHNGFSCAMVQTSLAFDIEMIPHFRKEGVPLIITELKEGDRGRQILSINKEDPMPTLDTIKELSGYEAPVFYASEPDEEYDTVVSIAPNGRTSNPLL